MSKQNILCLIASLTIMATPAIYAGELASTYTTNPSNTSNYCPPGAKYCPAPWADNTEFNNTHFGIDAQTGEVSVYRGDMHPSPYQDLPNAKEEVLFSQTGYEDYSNKPANNFSNTYKNNKNTAKKSKVLSSEVKSKTTSPTISTTSDENKVPWWKGGMWRNKKDGGEKKSSTQKAKEANKKSKQTTASNNNNSRLNNSKPVSNEEEDIWGDPVANYNNTNAPENYYNNTPTIGEVYTLDNNNNDSYASAQNYADTNSYIPAAPAVNSVITTPEFERAIRLVKENRFGEAKTILLSETISNPNNAAAWRWLGDCYYNLLELQSAIDAYEKALSISSNDYYALRGLGFAYLHRGHELWRQMTKEHSENNPSAAAALFSKAHEYYKNSLKYLGMCLQQAPNDSEAIYGKAMAAEGASRKLYSNAVSHLEAGPANRQHAELFAQNGFQVINEGIEKSQERIRLSPGEVSPRALLAGLYMRKAMLFYKLGKKELALAELQNSYNTQQSILEIDKNNETALEAIEKCTEYHKQWTNDFM